jgi:protein-L-isoaspartate(D-aspartate) O-methyltransferase
VEHDALTEHRLDMIETQIESRGVRDPDVIAAMRSVPRHLFVPDELQAEAYTDQALPIGHGQTISQPYIVGLMTAALKIDVAHTVLEVGTGSGYQTAILAEMADTVYTVELVPELSERAGAVLDRLGYRNVVATVGDGSVGLPEAAPFGGILVAAAAPEAPQPLLDQLADGARLVIPIGAAGRDQILTTIVRRGDRFETEPGIPCRFVPLLGERGFRYETGGEAAR